YGRVRTIYFGWFRNICTSNIYYPTEGITMNFWHAIIGMAGLALAGFIVTMLIDIPKIQDEDDEGLETVPSGANEVTPETNKETTKQEIEESAKQDIVASPL